MGLSHVGIIRVKEDVMLNWKTTLFGLLALLPPIIDAVTTVLPPKWAPILSAISGVIAFYFAKDKNVTGGTVAQ